jgi:hypothetical protein
MILRAISRTFFFMEGGGASEQAQSPESESKSEGEELDLQDNLLKSLNNFESD